MGGKPKTGGCATGGEKGGHGLPPSLQIPFGSLFLGTTLVVVVGNVHRPSPPSYANGGVFFHDHDVLGALKPEIKSHLFGEIER
jgi:hypothetical protein